VHLAATVALLAARLPPVRARLTVILHNVRPHDRGLTGGERRWLRLLLRRADRVVTLTEAAATDARDEYALDAMPDVVPHLWWRGRFAPVDAEEADAVLGLEPTRTARIVWFGQVRPYKGLDRIARALTDAPDAAIEVVLLGEVHGQHDAGSGLDELRRDPRVTWLERRVTDHEIAAACASADLAVFPFHEVDSSGSVLAALACGVPVLVPGLPAMLELRDELGSAWVRTFPDELDVAAIVRWCRAPRPVIAPHAPRREPLTVASSLLGTTPSVADGVV
jgi:beta-1,4-mannosyltransferase